MKYFFVLLCFIISGNAYSVPAVVDYIFDGDTFAATVRLDDDITVSTSVRLMNVDTPEIHSLCESEIKLAEKAKNRLADLLPIGSTVELRNIKDDKYLGRIDAYVLTNTGQDIGSILIKEKLGRPYDGGKRESWCQ